MLSNDINNAYIAILKEELRPAMGCTEPIAIAYAAAKAREVLGALPDRLVLEERLPCKQEVAGSIPTISTKFIFSFNSNRKPAKRL